MTDSPSLHHSSNVDGSHRKDRPDQFLPGDVVVIVREARHGDVHMMVETTVDKVGKRDIVLANGERFNVSRPRKSNGAWDSPTELLKVDSDRALRLRNELNTAKRRNRASTHVDQALKLLRDRNIPDARAQLQAAIDVLDGRR